MVDVSRNFFIKNTLAGLNLYAGFGSRRSKNMNRDLSRDWLQSHMISHIDENIWSQQGCNHCFAILAFLEPFQLILTAEWRYQQCPTICRKKKKHLATLLAHVVVCKLFVTYHIMVFFGVLVLHYCGCLRVVAKLFYLGAVPFKIVGILFFETFISPRYL